MKKKIFYMCLLISLVATTIIGTSLAYFTDKQTENNKFVSGKISIELEENFKQNSKLTPGQATTKEVKIKNTGNSPAYVWYTYSVPKILWESGALKITNGSDKWYNYSLESLDQDSVTYSVITVLYKNSLDAGKTTDIGMKEVSLDSKIDRIGDNYYFINNGKYEKLDYDLSDGLTINITAYAIQADGFNNVEDAYKAYIKQWSSS